MKNLFEMIDINIWGALVKAGNAANPKSEKSTDPAQQMLESEGGAIARFIAKHLYGHGGKPRRTITDTVIHDSTDKRDGKNRWWIKID